MCPEEIPPEALGTRDRSGGPARGRKLLAVFLLAVGATILGGCRAESAEGTITGAYQPMRSGMVQMYIEVRLDDSTEVDAVLPVDQQVWDRVTNSIRGGRDLRVEVRSRGRDAGWEFVRFVEE